MICDELSEREKFIFHTSMNMMILGDNDPSDIINHIRKHKCRNLSDEYIHELLKLLRDELTSSKIMWEEP
jgi:hypothetical protein